MHQGFFVVLPMIALIFLLLLFSFHKIDVPQRCSKSYEHCDNRDEKVGSVPYKLMKHGCKIFIANLYVSDELRN